MIVLGIDPGISKLGYGILQEEKGQLHLIEYGCIKNKKDKYSGLENIYTTVDNLIKKYKPTILAIEKVFFSKNTKTAMHTAEASGVVMFCAVKNKVEIVEFTPLQVKQATVGYGYASKEQIKYIIKSYLKIEGKLPYDAYDAVALAWCAISSYKIKKLQQ